MFFFKKNLGLAIYIFEWQYFLSLCVAYCLLLHGWSSFYTSVERSEITIFFLSFFSLDFVHPWSGISVSLCGSFFFQFLFHFLGNLLLEITFALSPYIRLLPQADHAMVRVNVHGSLHRIVRTTLWRFYGCNGDFTRFELLDHKLCRSFFGWIIH